MTERLAIQWIGTDGSVWDLGDGPVRLSTGGVSGFGLPEIEDQVRTTALGDGQELTGWRVKPRTVWLPLRFKDAGAQDVNGLQRAWWQSLAIGEVGTLVATDSEGGVRSIGLRVRSDGGMAYRINPYILTDAFGITFTADLPWWLGPAEERVYSLAPSITHTFFGDGLGATPFYIEPATGTDAYVLTNPGDTPAWIEWEITGPASAFRLGVNGHYISGAIDVPDGQTLTIATDPRQQIAMLNGAKVTRQLAELDWAPIPKGASVPVDISVTGTGVITARIRPKYARAF